MSWVTGLVSWFMGMLGITTTNTEEVVKVQAAAVRLCGFLPTVETVIALMGVVTPGVNMGTVIARKICTAVTASQAASKLLGSDKPKPFVDINGTTIVIEGEFVNG